MRRTILLAAALTLVASPTLVAPAFATDAWPHMRGPGFDGRTDAQTLPAGDIALDLAWRIPLGSGYSGIAVGGGKAVTLYSEGEGDWIGAFDTATGDRRWRYRLGDRFEGHDGSDDGPLSSPLIHDGRVVALAPRGRLVAVALDDGEEIWQRDLAAELAAVEPTFGFTTSPVVADGLLVVQAGGAEGRAIIGLDPASGTTRWARADDTVSYQSPIPMPLAGSTQIVAVSDSMIEGIAARTGDVLWSHALGEDRANSAVPTYIGDDRFLIAMGGGMTAYRVSRDADGFAVEEAYRSNTLGRKYAPPVYHDGHVYGFRGNILTCMNARDGSRVWRSRPPGGEGLVLVGDKLVIFAAGGDVVVADASPEGYVERARSTALEGAGLTWPSFAGNRVFVRNLAEMAAVRMQRADGDDAVDRQAAGGAFGRWLERIAAADDKAAVVDKLLDEAESGPFVDVDQVHFLLRAEADDVAIAGSMLPDTVEPMTQVPGTDLWYRSFALEPGLRWEYRFQLDYETWQTDPRNPRTVPGPGRAELSELVMDGYALADHLAEPTGARGTEESFTFESEALGMTKDVTVWLPPGYQDGERAYPLLVVNEGSAWRDKGLLTRSLDNLVAGKKIEPVIVAFVDASNAWWEEAGGSKVDAYVRMQAEELVPALGERYRISDRPADRATLGLRYYGASALYAAVDRPQVFGKAALLSPHLGFGVDVEMAERIAKGDGKSAHLYLDWSRHGERRLDRGIDFREAARTLDAELRAAGYQVTGGEVKDSAGWGAYRNRTDRFLVALFPTEG